MALQIRQTLRQIQQLVMTPQLQQAIKLLQYNHQEIADVLEQELKENPLLEVAREDEPLTDQQPDERNDLASLEDLVREPEPKNLEILDVDWQNYVETYGGDNSRINRDPNAPSPIDNLSKSTESLFHYLLAQLQLSHIEDQDRRIALELIGNVDENGYLDIEMEEVAKTLDVKLNQVKRVLKLVQEFDPPGVAARDLKECLLIQAGRLDPENPGAVRIIKEAFDLVQEGKLDKIARKLKMSHDEVQAAFKVISKLEPKPGRPYDESEVRYVVPDIYVIRVGNDYSVILNDDGLPRLKISPFYQQQLHNSASHSVAKDYIQDKMRGAMWLIKSIHQRQRTIYKVAKSIIKFQREFFDKGIDFLKPLVLKDVAYDVDMHESTISRVTSNKYMHTPRGIFELKFFFNSGLPHGVDSIASESVKNHISKIIKGENPQRPTSDKEIVDLLARHKIRIARRTVAKYRELMGIPPSSQRRKKF